MTGSDDKIDYLGSHQDQDKHDGAGNNKGTDINRILIVSKNPIQMVFCAFIIEC